MTSLVCTLYVSRLASTVFTCLSQTHVLALRTSSRTSCKYTSLIVEHPSHSNHTNPRTGTAHIQQDMLKIHITHNQYNINHTVATQTHVLILCTSSRTHSKYTSLITEHPSHCTSTDTHPAGQAGNKRYS